jgi:integrase
MHRIPKRCNNQIEIVLQKNKHQAAHKDKKVGQGSQDKRRTVIKGFFSDLFYLGYRIESIYNLKEKHLMAVFHFLEEQGQSPATIQNKISIMRVFCVWIGKVGMVGDSVIYVKDKSSVRRSMVVKEDKSWAGKGVDVLAKLAEVTNADETIALVLELCWAFGLRVQEALKLRPGVSHVGEFVWVLEGTKGERPRVIPVENAIQRNVLAKSKAIVDKKTGFFGKRGKTFKQKHTRFYTVMVACGITLRDDGITAHGLRYQYMHESFKLLMGIEPPIRGGDINQVAKYKYHEASQQLMERAGHTRVSIGASYYGSRRRAKS